MTTSVESPTPPKENPFIANKELIISRVATAATGLDLKTYGNRPAEELIRENLDEFIVRSGFQVPRISSDAVLESHGVHSSLEKRIESAKVRSAYMEYMTRVARTFGIVAEDEDLESLITRPNLVVLGKDLAYEERMKKIDENSDIIFIEREDGLFEGEPGMFHNLPTNLDGVIAWIFFNPYSGNNETRMTDKIRQKEIIPNITFYLAKTKNS